MTRTTASSHSSFPQTRRLWPVFTGLVVVWLVSLPLACLPGPVPLSAQSVFRALAALAGFAPAPDDPALTGVVVSIRLARVCLAALCGGALAMAGAALQGVLRNPLADPFTLGISAGAACGASMAIALGGPLVAMLGSIPWLGGVPGLAGFSHAGLVAPAALIGALAALGCALWLGRGDGAFSRESVILAGIAVAAFLGGAGGPCEGP